MPCKKKRASKKLDPAWYPTAEDERIREKARIEYQSGVYAKKEKRRLRHQLGRYDPQPLPKPIDLPGFDNLNNLRFVPYFKGNKKFMPVKGLIEGQMNLPQTQFIKSLMLINKNPEYGDIELTDENGDGYIDRFTRRGLKDEKKGRNLNLFVDIDAPSKDDRLLMENWKVENP